MQIGPIPDVRVLTAVKAQPVDPQLSALADIVATAKPDDDSYSKGAQKAAGAEEDEQDEQDDGQDELPGEERLSGKEPPEDTPTRSISYFA